MHDEDNGPISGKVVPDGVVHNRGIAMTPEYRAGNRIYYDDRRTTTRNRYGNEVVLNVDEAPIRRGERIYARPRSEGQLRRGKVIIVNRNGWEDDVRQGRMVDDMSPGEYMEHVGKYGRRGGRGLRPEGRRGPRKVGGRAMHYNRYDSDDDAVYEHDDEIGPSISQRASSNGDDDGDDISPAFVSKYNRFRSESTSSEPENDNLALSKYNNGGQHISHRGQRSSGERVKGGGGGGGTHVVQHNRLENVNEEEEGQLISLRSTEMVHSVRSVEGMPPVSDDYPVNGSSVNNRGKMAEQRDVENQQRTKLHSQEMKQLRTSVAMEKSNTEEHIQSDDIGTQNDVKPVAVESESVSNQAQASLSPKDRKEESSAATEIDDVVETSATAEDAKQDVNVENDIDKNQSARYMNNIDNKDGKPNGGAKIVNESDEIKLQKGVGVDDDQDSGISRSSAKLKTHPMMEKKSIFTIAYDGVQSKHKVVENADIVRTPTPP